MPEAIGIRLDEETLKRLDRLLNEEETDRSTMIRKLINRGYKEIVKEKAAKDYMEGKITFSESAHKADLTIWEMQQYLVSKGFHSQYSGEDLMLETVKLTKVKRA